MVAAGQVVRASDDVLLTKIGCRLRRAANQSIPNITPTAILFDTEDDDTSEFIAVTSTTVTIPAGYDGLYAITFRVAMSLAAGRSFAELTFSSAVTGLPNLRVPGSTLEGSILASPTVPLLAGDSFTAVVFQSTGGATNATAWLSCYRIGVFD